MLQPRNTRSFSDLFSGFDAMLRHYVIDRPRAYWHILSGRLENLPETNFNLGCDFASRGLWFDASLRFRVALYLKPDYVQAWYNLGCSYMQLGKRAQAYDAFTKALKLQPQHQEARFMISSLAPDNIPVDTLPRTMPSHMITGFFTQMAPEYDAIVAANGYRAPELVFEACRPYLTRTTGLHVVDLGCGTGLIAKPWRALAREILGVDLTPAMVAAAQVARSGDHPAYDRVLQDDITRIAPGTFMPGVSDVVVCIDVVQFAGDLLPVMKTAASALVSGGLFIISTEPYQAPRGYGVNPDTGRFGHTVEYVKATAQTVGLELKRDGRSPLYSTQVNHLFVFAKKAGA